MGSEHLNHQPRVFNLRRCICPSAVSGISTVKYDCIMCSLPCDECGNSCKQMVPFDYMSFVKHLKLLCQRSMNCHEFLAMWYERGTWLGHSSTEEPQIVKEIWDSEKLRIFPDFWNLDDVWELPIVCQTKKSRKIYRAFHLAMKSKDLIEGWNAQQQEYGF